MKWTSRNDQAIKNPTHNIMTERASNKKASTNQNLRDSSGREIDSENNSNNDISIHVFFFL
jgi:hypothetical protein